MLQLNTYLLTRTEESLPICSQLHRSVPLLDQSIIECLHTVKSHTLNVVHTMIEFIKVSMKANHMSNRVHFAIENTVYTNSMYTQYLLLSTTLVAI